METSKMIQELKRLSEKHKNDRVNTFSVNWSLLCKDVAYKIEDLDNKLKLKNKKIEDKLKDIDNIFDNKNTLNKEEFTNILKEFLV